MDQTFAQSLQEYLRQGKIDPACHLALQLAQRPGSSPESAGQTLAQCLNQLLDEFVIDPVVRFHREMDTNLPAEIVEAVQQALDRRMAVILDWAKKISLVTRERQARELRSAVRGRNLDEAERIIGTILVRPGQTGPERGLLGFVGNILGSVEHGQREAEQLVERLRANDERLGLTGDMVDQIETAREERQRGAGGAASEYREAEFVRDLNALTVELKGWLPSAREMGAATEEQIVRFYQALHAVVASVFLGGNGARWVDVTLVLVEYCPRELSIAGRRSGVEERAYMTLSPAARRTVFEAFGRLGRSEIVVRSYLEFAQTVGNERLLRNVAEVMGAMRSKHFLPWLRKTFESQSAGSMRGVILSAISCYADGDSAQIILNALETAIRKGKRRGAVPEGPERRAAYDAMFALGRIVRSPRMDPGGRNEILKRAIALMPEKDLRLQHELAYQCFRTPSDSWDDVLRQWALKVLTQSLWLGDMTPDFAEGDDRQANILGVRGPTVQALAAMGKDAVPSIVRACEESDLRYSGAFMAVAEALGQIGDPRGLDLLERLIANTLMVDDSDRTTYQAEKYYDSTEGVRKELTPDVVMSAILFAVERIGGEKAETILARVYNQIQAPGASSPGTETNELLERFRQRLTREGRFEDALRKAAERRPEPGEKRSEKAERQAAAEALKDLRGRFFLKGKRRTRKITAIQTLTSQRNVEAIPLIIGHLEDSDTMVRAAAETALGEYALAATNETVLRALTYALIEGLRSRDEAVRQKIRNTFRRLGPNREPLHAKLVALMRDATDPLLRAEAELILHGEPKEEEEEAAKEQIPLPDVEISPVDAPPQRAAPPRPPAEKPAASGKEVSFDKLMDLKRQYLRARQEWIRGGKKGQPPAPPPELNGL